MNGDGMTTGPAEVWINYDNGQQVPARFAVGFTADECYVAFKAERGERRWAEAEAKRREAERTRRALLAAHAAGPSGLIRLSVAAVARILGLR